MKNSIFEILTDKKKTREEGLIVIDNEKIIKDLLNEGFKLKYFLHSRDCGEIIKKYGIKQGIIKVKDSMVNKLSDVENDRGFIAVFEMPQGNRLAVEKEKKLVLFDTIQDPSNAGAIIRSGAAFGFISYLFMDSVYIFNSKAIRSSAGACFMVKYSDVDFGDVKKLKDKKYKIIITDSEKGEKTEDVKNYLNDRFLLVFGNEGTGIRDEIKEISDASIKINYPNKKIESLNVANAASILFYEINKMENV